MLISFLRERVGEKYFSKYFLKSLDTFFLK